MKEMQKTQSPAIHDINGTMFQDNLKQLMKHQKTRLPNGKSMQVIFQSHSNMLLIIYLHVTLQEII